MGARRGCQAAQLRADPRLVEPVFLVEITCPMESCKGCYSVCNQRRGVIFDTEPVEGTQDQHLMAYLPVAESFGFTADLRSQTGGQAFPQCVLIIGRKSRVIRLNLNRWQMSRLCKFVSGKHLDLFVVLITMKTDYR